MVAHTFNHSTLQTKADLWVQGQHGLPSEFQASLHSKTLVSKIEKSFLNIVWSGGSGTRRGVAFSSCIQKAFVGPFTVVPSCLPLNLRNSLCVASFSEKCITLTVFLYVKKYTSLILIIMKKLGFCSSEDFCLFVFLCFNRQLAC